MKRMTFSMPDSLFDKIKEISEDLNTSNSKIFRKIISYFIFLYDFMNEYMEPNHKNPPNNYLKEIEKIGEIINVLSR